MSQDPAALRAELLELMNNHDWNYSYSDDYRYWTQEAEKSRRINALVKMLPDGPALLAERILANKAR